jgi:phosphate transport system permease protein
MSALDQSAGRVASPATAAGSARTIVPPRQAVASEQEPRPLTSFSSRDVIAIAAALVAAMATTGLLWTQLAPFTGLLGYVVVTWCLFVLIYAILVASENDRPALRDRVAAVVVHSLALIVLAALAFVIFYAFIRGWKALVHLNFFTHDLHSTGPRAPLTKGGILHAIVGTLIEITIALGIAVPLGLVTAVYMHEVPGRLSRFIRTVVQAMTALPDVLAGLFIYATLILIFHLGPSGFAAGCALAITAIPIICRAADVVLRLVPGGLTEASYALGAGQWRSVWHVTLPTARSGLATAVILGTARAIGETSPPLLTAGATAYLNFKPIGSPMMSLPLQAYTGVTSPEPGEIARGFGAAAVLLIVVLLLFALLRVVGGRGPGQLTAGQQRRRAARSRRLQASYQRRAAAEIAAGYPADSDHPGAMA